MLEEASASHGGSTWCWAYLWIALSSRVLPDSKPQIRLGHHPYISPGKTKLHTTWKRQNPSHSVPQLNLGPTSFSLCVPTYLNCCIIPYRLLTYWWVRLGQKKKAPTRTTVGLSNAVLIQFALLYFSLPVNDLNGSWWENQGHQASVCDIWTWGSFASCCPCPVMTTAVDRFHTMSLLLRLISWPSISSCCFPFFLSSTKRCMSVLCNVLLSSIHTLGDY